jgi:hypothetical protein
VVVGVAFLKCPQPISLKFHCKGGECHHEPKICERWVLTSVGQLLISFYQVIKPLNPKTHQQVIDSFDNWLN